MPVKENTRTAIKFLFTPEGFTPDVSSLDTEEEQREAARWMRGGGYPALYQMGLEGRPKEADP